MPNSGNNSLAKTSKKKMRLARRNSIADTSNFNSLQRKTTEELTRAKTEDDADKLAQIEAKLKRERDTLKDIYDDAVDRGLNEVIIQKLEDDLEAKAAELEQVRNVYDTAGKYTYYAGQLKASTRFNNNPAELQANMDASKPNEKRLNNSRVEEEFQKSGKEFDEKFNHFKQLYKGNTKFKAKIDSLRNALAKGDWVFMNDKHSDATAFALARLLMEGADPGKVLLEQPYSLNWDSDMLTGMMSFAQGIGKIGGPWPAVLSKKAIANDWLPVPVDAMSNNSTKVETNALRQSGVTGHDNQYFTSTGGIGNWVRQNYIARNVSKEMKNSETGGIVVYGTKHLTGDTKTGEIPLQDIVSTNNYTKTQQIKLADGDKESDYFAIIVPKDTLREYPEYSTAPQKPISEPQRKTLTRNLAIDAYDLDDHAAKMGTDKDTVRRWIRQINPNHQLLISNPDTIQTETI